MIMNDAIAAEAARLRAAADELERPAREAAAAREAERKAAAEREHKAWVDKVWGHLRGRTIESVDIDAKYTGHHGANWIELTFEGGSTLSFSIDNGYDPGDECIVMKLEEKR